MPRRKSRIYMAFFEFYVRLQDRRSTFGVSCGCVASQTLSAHCEQANVIEYVRGMVVCSYCLMSATVMMGNGEGGDSKYYLQA